MMLSPDELDSSTTPNPAIRSLNRTLIQRVIEGVAVETEDGPTANDAIDEDCFEGKTNTIITVAPAAFTLTQF